MSKDLFIDFVGVCYEGNQAKAALALGVDRSLINRICAGERGVSPALAARVELLSAGLFKKERFIWPGASNKSCAALASCSK